MLTWIDGELWSQSKDLGENNKAQLGRLIASVDSQLANVDCTDYRATLDQPFGWNALQAKELVADIALIKDAELREHVSTIFNRITNRTLAKVLALPHQLIHNDANDNNVVVAIGSVTGLIDFGDLIYAPRVCGLAVGCAYQLDANDPVASIYAIVRGYHEVSALSPAELEVLFDEMFHLFFDLGEVLFRDRRGKNEIVIESILNRRSESEFGSGTQFHHRLCEDVG
jgi:Ser/Thr protein kinase RdoA (MazF antagonist)